MSSFPVLADHNLRVESADPETSSLLSAAQASWYTAWTWPRSTDRNRPVLPSHSRMDLSKEAEARRWFNERNYEKSLEFWAKMGVMAEAVVTEPSKLLILVRKSVQICLWKMYGNRALQ